MPFFCPKHRKINRKCPEMAPLFSPRESQVARNSGDIVVKCSCCRFAHDEFKHSGGKTGYIQLMPRTHSNSPGEFGRLWGVSTRSAGPIRGAHSEWACHAALSNVAEIGRHSSELAVRFAYESYRGPRNGAFGKPCLCPRDTRHFRHLRRFTGFEQQSPCFIG